MTRTEQSAKTRSVRGWFLLAVILLTFGTIQRIAGLSDEPLWYDELYSATQAASQLTDVTAAVRAFDMHPPLYYLQLSAWSKFGQSDAWLRLNSTVWWLATGIALFWVAHRLTSVKAAVLTTVFYSLNPAGIHFARELRMYSMLMFLALCGFYLTERWFVVADVPGDLPTENDLTKPSSPASYGRSDRARLWLPILLVTTAAVYSHGASFLILAALWAHAGWMLLTRQSTGRVYIRFMLIQLVAVLLGLTEHVRAASMHLSFEQGLSYAIAPTIAQLIEQCSWLFSGRGAPFGSWTVPLTVLTTGIPLALACCSKGPARRATMFYIGIPIAICCTISHVSRPIWVFRVISFTIPFCCFALATGVMRLPPIRNASDSDAIVDSVGLRWVANAVRSGLVALLLVGMCLGADAQRGFYPRTSHVHRMAHVVADQTAAGDVVIVPQRYCYWAICWYLVGPGTVQPLTDPGHQTFDGEATIVKVDAKRGFRLTNAETATQTRMVTNGETGRYFMITIGAAQTERFVQQLRLEHVGEPVLVGSGGPIHLWRLPNRR